MMLELVLIIMMMMDGVDETMVIMSVRMVVLLVVLGVLVIHRNILFIHIMIIIFLRY